jgi:hypothetical protein
LKTGLLSPIFKNKGEKTDSKNYLGIAVLPILLKIIEAILKVDLRNGKFYIQSPLQRRFTENASPLNAAIVLEEEYREYKDEFFRFFLVLLDAKSAFDVVVLKMLLRKVYLTGINPASWSLIDDLHHNTKACIKWMNELSEEFPIFQGVKQGGILSADLYKIYIEDLLDNFQHEESGCKFGNLTINAITCADDIALTSHTKEEMQIWLI